MAKARNKETAPLAALGGSPAGAGEERPGMGRIASDIESAIRRFRATRGPVLDAAFEALAARVRSGGKILIIDNGGSAAEAKGRKLR